MEDLKGKIRVFCRSRPISENEIKLQSKDIVRIPDEMTCNILGKNGIKTFNFDAVFGAEATQELIFEDTARLVQSAVDGYNVCIFAYG